MIESKYEFAPQLYEKELSALIEELLDADPFDKAVYESIIRRYPKDGRGLFSKSEIIRGFRHLKTRAHWGQDELAFLERLRMKPIRTQSGVAPVTVLAKPYPCPGRCIFCPSDVRMPKSYISSEPGAQRAAQHRFDPYSQSFSRLRTYYNIGHQVDKVELIILGGTWSYYPESYQLWFVKRCLDALNDFSEATAGTIRQPDERAFDFSTVIDRIDGRSVDRTYNQIIDQIGKSTGSKTETATWEDLARAQRQNETALARCVGLVVETRPDHLTSEEVVRIRRLGTTKVQIGYQSLSDRILGLNHRGHDVAATRRAMHLLRGAGFKIHAHWMPNLYGSTPELDLEDFDRIFSDPDFRPDELKIYPCSLIESAELMSYYESGHWQPYSESQLLSVLQESMRRTPEYCRLTRVIRDIPGTDIVAGSRVTNFRQIAQDHLADEGIELHDIRSREIRGLRIVPSELDLRATEYETSVGTEFFLQFVTPNDQIAAFLRLSLPAEPVEIDEIRLSAMIREVHVYGLLASIGQRDHLKSQHLGLGRRLIDEAARRASHNGYRDLTVISSIGTRAYYRGLGFVDGELYQHLAL
jgi:elongator complex protein 3